MPPPLRLTLLPISTRRALIYCDPLSSIKATGAKPSILDRVTNKANETWADWERSNTSWKLKLVQYGNMMFRRIPFEEWGLKSIPPLSSAEKGELQKLASGTAIASTNGRDTRLDKVEVRYPSRYFNLIKPSIIEMLEKIATERKELHRKRMIYSMIAMPFTIPVAILPVIPNIPFFYLAFRAWSHWKALRGSEHLELLLKANKVKPMPLNALDNLYTAGLLYPTREESRKNAEPTDSQTQAVVQQLEKQTDGGKEDVLLLHEWNGKLIAERLKLPGLQVEIERAVEQVEKGLEEKKEKGKLSMEKQEVEALAQQAAHAAPSSTATKPQAAKAQGK